MKETKRIEEKKRTVERKEEKKVERREEKKEDKKEEKKLEVKAGVRDQQRLERDIRDIRDIRGSQNFFRQTDYGRGRKQVAAVPIHSRGRRVGSDRSQDGQGEIGCLDRMYIEARIM